MKTFDQAELDTLFKEYYRAKGVVATHLFIMSQGQLEIGRNMNMRINNNVFGLPYTEMRARDSDPKFGWDDAEIVSVGTIVDINK